MNHFTFSAVTTFISSLFTAIYFLTRPSRLLKLYGLYWADIAFWSFTVGFQARLLKLMPDTIWGWLLHLGCLFVPAIFVHFAAEFSMINNKFSKKITISGYAITIIYLALNSFTNYFTHGTSYRDFYAYPTPSSVYFMYFISFVLMILIGTYFLLLKLKNETNVERKKWLLIFIIFHAVAYIGAIDNFFIMADIKIFPWYPFGLYPVFLYAIIGGYSLRRVVE